MSSTSDLIAENTYHKSQITANLDAADVYLCRYGYDWEFLTFKKSSGGSLAVVDVNERVIALAAPLDDFDFRSVNTALRALHLESARVLTESVGERLTKL